MDLKNTLEVFDAVESEADAILAAAADGKLTILDLRHELPVIQKAKVAFQDIGQVRAELKDLDEAEANQLFDKVLTVGTKITAAFAAVSAIINKG